MIQYKPAFSVVDACEATGAAARPDFLLSGRVRPPRSEGAAYKRSNRLSPSKRGTTACTTLLLLRS